jgi:hypothetical protein
LYYWFNSDKLMCMYLFRKWVLDGIRKLITFSRTNLYFVLFCFWPPFINVKLHSCICFKIIFCIDNLASLNFPENALLNIISRKNYMYSWIFTNFWYSYNLPTIFVSEISSDLIYNALLKHFTVYERKRNVWILCIKSFVTSNKN